MLTDLFPSSQVVNLDHQTLHILKVNIKTGKLTVRYTTCYTSQNTCIIPKMNSQVTLSKIKVKEDVFKYFMLCNNSELNIFVTDEYSNKKSVNAEEKQARIKLYKRIVSECLKDCIYRLTKVYSKTQSKEVGEEINRLNRLYLAYSTGTQ